MILTIAQVAAGTRCPLDAVTVAWPLLVDGLVEFGIDTGLMEVAHAATVAVETAYTFRPSNERWARGETEAQYFARYAPPNPVAAVLGNRNLADAIACKGRGYNEITGRYNYIRCGEGIGVDLIDTPEKLLDPETAARAAAWFMKTHGHYTAQHHWGLIPQYVAAQNWPLVRQSVQGGMANYTEFKDIVDRALTYLPDATPEET